MMKKQHGVTLIELMVAMMLGLGLVAGIGQLFIQSQKSFTMQRNLSDMMDDGVFALEDLAKGLLLAGYSDDGSSVANYIGNNSTDNELYYSFKLGDSSQLNNSICITGTPAIGSIITVRIYKDSANNDAFSCVSNVTAQPLIQNVEKILFRYGIRNKISRTFYYTDAATVTANNLWSNVFAIKVFLVLRSTDDNLVRIQKGYEIDGVQQTPVPTDRRMYKTFSKTIFLRAPAQ